MIRYPVYVIFIWPFKLSRSNGRGVVLLQVLSINLVIMKFKLDMIFEVESLFEVRVMSSCNRETSTFFQKEELTTSLMSKLCQSFDSSSDHVHRTLKCHGHRLHQKVIDGNFGSNDLSFILYWRIWWSCPIRHTEQRNFEVSTKIERSVEKSLFAQLNQNHSLQLKMSASKISK